MNRTGLVIVALFVGILGVYGYPEGEAENAKFVLSHPPKDPKHKLKLLYEWKEILYAYPNHDDEKHDIKNGVYKPGQPFLADVDAYYPDGNHDDPIVFVTTPKVISGVPATLSVILPKQIKGNHLLDPYPSWDWHKNPEKCKKDRLISVIRIEVDRCGRLWVLDDGKIENKRVCAPQIIAFDIKHKKVVHRYQIPDTQHTSRSFFFEIVVDIRDFCDKNIFVYAADAKTNGLIVWDVDKDISWRIQDKTMYPDIDHAVITINDQCVEFMYGIIGMALTPYSPYEKKDRKLFFHSLNAVTEHWVSTADIRNHALFSAPVCFPGQLTFGEIFHTFSHKRSSQCLAEAIDKNGILIYGLLGECSLYCYNTKEGEFGDKKNTDIIHSDKALLDYINALKVVDNIKEKCQELWMLTNRFQKVATCTRNSDEVNFRIFAGRVVDLIEGKRCKPKTFKF